MYSRIHFFCIQTLSYYNCLDTWYLAYYNMHPRYLWCIFDAGLDGLHGIIKVFFHVSHHFPSSSLLIIHRNPNIHPYYILHKKQYVTQTGHLEALYSENAIPTWHTASTGILKSITSAHLSVPWCCGSWRADRLEKQGWVYFLFSE